MTHTIARALRTLFPALTALCLISALQPFSPSALAQQTPQPAPAPAPAAAQPAGTLAPPTLEELDEDLVTLSTFTVTETRTEGYDSRYTTSGMRTAQELKNVPNSLSVINATFISDVGALDTVEMSKWLVTGEDNPDPLNPGRQIIRGIQSNYPMRNGWIWYTSIDRYSIDRYELVRGPNSFLFGESDVGGINNTLTKRALFKRTSPTRVSLMTGSYDLFRAEFDTNKMVNRYVAIRAAGVYTKNHEWFDHGRREFMGLYLAATIRPTKTTTIHINGEINKSDRVTSTGLYNDAYTYTDNGSHAGYTLNGAYYTPVDGRLLYNTSATPTTARSSSGSGLAIIDPGLVPKKYQFKGPESNSVADQISISIEIEQKLTEKLHLMLSANFYSREIEDWLAINRAIYKDNAATLADGSPNPRKGEYYAEYQRQHQYGGNIVRDMRASLVYNWDNLKWMKQQFVFNVQQHQDNPGQRFPKLAEYADPATWGAASRNMFVSNQAATRTAYRNMQSAFSQNRFYRRYYLSDGDGANITGSLAAIPGVSAYYPDYNGYGGLSSDGAMIDRRFYTPSYGIGAAGTYFGGHLFTLFGYRKDKFHMRSTYGAPEVYSDTDSWNVRPYEDGQRTVYNDYTEISRNAGVVVRVNDNLAFNYNYGQSTRLSLGLGNNGLFKGTTQGIPTGEGNEYGVRLAFKQDSIIINATYYDNYQPNARQNISMGANIREVLAAMYDDFDPSTSANGDNQQLTTKGYEVEITASLTKNWRLTFNFANNKMIAENRVPQLHAIYNRVLNDPTFDDPQMQQYRTDLGNIVALYPEGAPTSGYTKNRANIFTRYDFKNGFLKGFYISGGANWRDKTYRGTMKEKFTDTQSITVWSPSYTTVSMGLGYRTRIFDRYTTFALNIDNLFDKDYYRSTGVGYGFWGDPRSFKFTMNMDF